MALINAGQNEFLLPDWLRRCAQNYPDRLALRMGSTGLSFAELDRRVTILAAHLATLGIHAGDRVALLAANSLDYAVFVHALMRLGAILVPLNVRLTADELAWQITDTQATLLVHDVAHAELAIQIAQRTQEAQSAPAVTPSLLETLIADSVKAPEDSGSLPSSDLIDLAATQAIIYTSGTTGRPKGARITYGMHWWNAIGSALNLGLREDDLWLACLPFYHIGGLSILMRSVIYGMSVSVYERFDAQAIHAEMLAGEVSLISVVAVTLQRLLAEFDQPDARYPDWL
ncbi:MAG TPA: AMP-binding protein, partial [Ktedonobacterales bacterium]|nr:AMP-binding protein [Ktedonobacterales bacterium]